MRVKWWRKLSSEIGLLINKDVLVTELAVNVLKWCGVWRDLWLRA